MSLRRLVTLLRVLVLGLLLGGSALASHSLYADETVADASCCADCPGERSGHECPPECPDCHCHHSGGMTMNISAPESEALPSLAPHRSEPPRGSREAEKPQEPFRSAIYRPPRRLDRLA